MIIYTNHAKARLLQRKIKKEWVLKTIENPNKSIKTKEGRIKNTKKVTDEKISVVFVVEKQKHIVITVYWGE